MDKTQIRHAATVVLLRDADTDPKILMGQRGKHAVFMPNKYVFPGGALDPADHQIPLLEGLSGDCLARLKKQADPDLAETLVLSAIREVWEETGLFLGAPITPEYQLPAPMPEDWQGFFDHGLAPTGRGLEFVFRAITPPGRPRRFDARFFLADADHLTGDLDDFSSASDELSHLHWVPMENARSYDLPFITEVVLAEIQSLLADRDRPHAIPFFYHQDGRSFFSRL